MCGKPFSEDFEFIGARRSYLNRYTEREVLDCLGVGLSERVNQLLNMLGLMGRHHRHA